MQISITSPARQDFKVQGCVAEADSTRLPDLLAFRAVDSGGAAVVVSMAAAVTVKDKHAALISRSATS